MPPAQAAWKVADAQEASPQGRPTGSLEGSDPVGDAPKYPSSEDAKVNSGNLMKTI